MDIDHTRPHRRVQQFTLDRVLTTYLRRLDRSIERLGQLHKLSQDIAILKRLGDLARVVSPHDARELLPVIPNQSQNLAITSPPWSVSSCPVNRRVPSRT